MQTLTPSTNPPLADVPINLAGLLNKVGIEKLEGFLSQAGNQAGNKKLEGLLGFSLEGARLALGASGPVGNVDQAIRFFEQVGYKLVEGKGNNGEDITYYFSNPKLGSEDFTGPGSQYFKLDTQGSNLRNFALDVQTQEFAYSIKIQVTNQKVVSIEFPGRETPKLILVPPQELSFRKTDTGVIAYVGPTKLTDWIESKFGVKGGIKQAPPAKT